MSTLTSISLGALIVTLLMNEEFIDLVLACLVILHALTNITYLIVTEYIWEHYPILAAHLPTVFDKVIAFGKNYYVQIFTAARPVLRASAWFLTNITTVLVRNAPCVLCTVGTWFVGVAETLAKWLVGEGAQQAVVQEQWAAMQNDVAAYCAQIGGCA